MAIDVGPGCDHTGDSGNEGKTVIEAKNAANATGTIDYVCFSNPGSGPTIDVATFIHEGSNAFSTRGVASGLACSGGTPYEFNAPGDFTAFDVNIGDYFGVYVGGDVDFHRDAGGTPRAWSLYGDRIPCSSLTFSLDGSDKTYAMYATGEEIGVGVAPTGALYGPLVGPLGGPI